MDVPLYAIALAVFAVLYIAIGVFLAFTLIITLIVMYLYLAIRHGNVAQNYPHSLGDSLITITFIGVTWGIFVFLAAKNPIPFIGHGLTYTASANIQVTSILEIGFVLAIIFLVVMSFIAPRLRDSLGLGSGAAPGSTTTTESKPKQGVGA